MRHHIADLRRAALYGLVATAVFIAGSSSVSPDDTVTIADPISLGSVEAAAVEPSTIAGVAVAPAAVSQTAVRITEPVEHPSFDIPDWANPAMWGTAGSQIEGRCTQFEPLFAAIQPDGGWDVERMSSYAWREGSCCPQLLHGDTWQTTRGGDRGTETCVFVRVAERTHRSDAGLLQINGINYDPSRCGPCLSDMLGEPVDRHTLGDPAQNIRAAVALCEFWRAAGSSCYQPWRR